MPAEPEHSALAPRLTPTELAYGVPIGRTGELSRRATRLSPLQAFENELRSALMRPPCLVSFSGGRDSSGILALATHVARSEGLALPIPATLVFEGDAMAEESDWQNLVITHLGVKDWIRYKVPAGSLDAVGPVATSLLRRHGLIWPFNAHFHAPLILQAPGGSMITGFGGDEIGMSSATALAEQALSRTRRLRRSDVAVIGFALSPDVVRRIVFRRRHGRSLARLDYLTNAGRQAVVGSLARADAALPFGWSRLVRTYIARGRYFEIAQRGFELIGQASDTQIHHPFVAEGVLDAFAQEGGWAGLGSRAEIMRRLFGTVLPSEVLDRRSKASFTDPLWTEQALNYATEWSGAGISPIEAGLVDAEKLRSHWLSGHPDLLSTSMLQAAWLSDRS